MTITAAQFRLHSNCFCHFCPTLVLLSFQSPQVDSGDSKAAVVKKTTHVLDSFPGIASQFGSGMPEDVHSGGGDASLSEISLQVAVECAAGDSVSMVR